MCPGIVPRLLLAVFCFAALSLAGPGDAQAQAYPAKPLRLIVPVAPGGPTDIVARIVAQELGETLGRAVVVENRAGAGGLIGTEAAAKAAPDGYTLLVGHIGTFGTNPSLYAKLPYDPIEDFVPVTQLVRLTNILCVHPSLPVGSVRDLVGLARSQPGKLNYASSGNGTSQHLFMELFKSMAGVDIVNVTYKGSAPALIDVIGGQVPVMFDGISSALPHIKAEKLRPLAVSSASRSPIVPEVPTVAEAGIAGFEANSWLGVLAPRGTPAEIVGLLNRELAKIVQTPQVKQNLLGKGAESVGGTQPEFAAFIRAEIEKWARVIKLTGARVN